MLPQLEALLRASPAVLSFDLVDSDPIDDANFLLGHLQSVWVTMPRGLSSRCASSRPGG
jgi:hypothetical protein